MVREGELYDPTQEPSGDEELGEEFLNATYEVDPYSGTEIYFFSSSTWEHRELLELARNGEKARQHHRRRLERLWKLDGGRYQPRIRAAQQF